MDLALAGHPVHTRALTLLVSEHGADRVRALANVIDLRKTGFAAMFGDVQPMGLIHDMALDAEVDLASARLERLETVQRRVAVEPGPITRGESCRDPAGNLQALVGRPIDAAFARALGAVHGGPRGCSHLLTLFQLIADALPRALERERRLRAEGAQRRASESLFRRSLLFDGALSDDALRLVVQLGDFHNAPDDGVHQADERLVHVREARVLAVIDLQTGRIAEVRAAERERHETRPPRSWVDRSADAQALVGQLILPGLGSFVMGRFSERPADHFLRHALLHLAPGFVQCTAVFGERRASAKGGARSPLPVPLGGYADSCYMWRSDGPLIRLRGAPARS